MTSTTSYRSRQLSDSDSSSSDEDNDQPWKRQRKTRTRETPLAVSNARPTPSSSTSSASNKRKKNNIWGEVVQQQEEEKVARDMTQFDMHRNKERDVESYSYRQHDNQRKSQPLGNPIRFDDNSSSRDRKMPAALGDSNDDSWLVDESAKGGGMKNRLGSRIDVDSEGVEKMKFFSTMKPVSIKSDMHKKEVAGQIAYSLQEPYRDMVKTAVYELGIEKAIAVWEQTCDIEKNGGMLINTGHRRRTPGGVFFQLLKTDTEVTKEKKDIIFAMSKLQSKQDSKNKRKRRRKGKSMDKGTQLEGQADSMDVEIKQEEKSNSVDMKEEEDEKTNSLDLETKQESVVDIHAETKQEGAANAMDLEMKQELDEVKGNTNGKSEVDVTSGVEHGADKVEEMKPKKEAEADELEASSEKLWLTEKPDEEEESGSSEEEEEKEEEPDIGKAIERRLMEIKQEKQKSSEDGRLKDQERAQKGSNCAEMGEQNRGGEDANMEDGEVSD